MFNFLRKKIGIIGFGNMGSAIAERIKSRYDVFVFEKEAEKTKSLSGIKIVSSIPELLKQAQVIILAIKPQDFESAMAEIKDGAQDKLIVSIAAGITTGYMERLLGQVRVIRVMPNLAARVGKSTTSICKGAFATDKDISFTFKLFKYLGSVFILSEDMMDAATAIAGSGPGFLCDRVKDMSKSERKKYSQEHFIPEFSLAAENVGFNKKQAWLFATSTTSGTLATVEALGITPEELKVKVTSKGGTTEAGLEVLHTTGLLTEAAKAAVKRSKELSRG